MGCFVLQMSCAETNGSFRQNLLFFFPEMGEGYCDLKCHFDGTIYRVKGLVFKSHCPTFLKVSFYKLIIGAEVNGAR